jgi:hypothetical protein
VREDDVGRRALRRESQLGDLDRDGQHERATRSGVRDVDDRPQVESGELDRERAGRAVELHLRAQRTLELGLPRAVEGNWREEFGLADQDTDEGARRVRIGSAWIEGALDVEAIRGNTPCVLLPVDVERGLLREERLVVDSHDRIGRLDRVDGILRVGRFVVADHAQRERRDTRDGRESDASGCRRILDPPLHVEVRARNDVGK